MMIPQMLNSELSTSSGARTRAGAPQALLCMLGIAVSALACSGSIDDNQDVASSRPATSATPNGPSSAAPSLPGPVGASTETSSTEVETIPSDLIAGERSSDDIVGVRGGSRSDGTRRRSGGSRARDLDDKSDAGQADAGDADAGEADAGEDEADLLALDAGPVADAGPAIP